MNRVSHFDIPADDPTRAINFYTNVFGWKFTKWDEGQMDYWMVETGPKDQPGINGGLMKRARKADPEAGNNAFVCTIDVESLEEIRQKIEANGGRAFDEEMEIPGTGIIQNFFDTEGNFFGVIEMTGQGM